LSNILPIVPLRIIIKLFGLTRVFFFFFLIENPFEIILGKLNSIEKAIEKLNGSSNNHADTLFPDAEISSPVFSGI
jgi:hypothetical protein